MKCDSFYLGIAQIAFAHRDNLNKGKFLEEDFIFRVGFKIAKCIPFGPCTDVSQEGRKWLNGVLTRHNINGDLPRDNWSNPLHLSRATLEQSSVDRKIK